MIVDTSAIMAILLKEEDADRYLRALDGAGIRRMSGVSMVELTIVADRKDNPVPGALVDDFVGTAKILVKPVTAEQIALARGAHLSFGRGRHPARLNLGDCFVYALAKATGEPLLFKGNDFAHTDVESAL